MNIQAKMPTTPDEFLRWNEGREGKREFVGGKVVEMMINVTRNHWRLANRLTQQLIGELGTERYDIGTADFGVRTPDGIRYPDVMVEPFGHDGKALATSSPVFLAEVLSPSTMANDFGPKAQAYLGLSTLKHYLILSQDSVRLWLWSRSPENSWSGPELMEDTADLVLGHLGATINLAALYAGVAAPRFPS